MRGYDWIAPFYDFLAALVSCGGIEKSQNKFLGKIPDRSKILILGGGTGKILFEIGQQKSDCQIWYADTSPGMIARARRQKVNLKIDFICGGVELVSERDFDVVVTPFFLDQFSSDGLDKIIQQIDGRVSRHAIFLVTDFTDPEMVTQKWLLKGMYFFFSRVIGIEARHLPLIHQQLASKGWQLAEEASFCHGFINSSVYKRIIMNT